MNPSSMPISAGNSVREGDDLIALEFADEIVILNFGLLALDLTESRLAN